MKNRVTFSEKEKEQSQEVTLSIRKAMKGENYVVLGNYISGSGIDCCSVGIHHRSGCFLRRRKDFVLCVPRVAGRLSGYRLCPYPTVALTVDEPKQFPQGNPMRNQIRYCLPSFPHLKQPGGIRNLFFGQHPVDQLLPVLIKKWERSREGMINPVRTWIVSGQAKTEATQFRQGILKSNNCSHPRIR
jgi:hypothetical protein